MDENKDKFIWVTDDIEITKKVNPKPTKTKHFPESIVSTKGWGITLNISVPIDQIPSYMYFQDRPEEAE